MDCHDLIGTWSISILKLILENNGYGVEMIKCLKMGALILIELNRLYENIFCIDK